MTLAGSSRRRSAGLSLGVLALVSAGLAVWAAVSGGFRVSVFGIPLSVRGELRPAFLALLLGLGSVHLLNLWPSRAHVRRLLLDAWQSPAMSHLSRLLPRAAPWIAIAASLAVLAIGIDNVSTVAAGADSSGYLSQARLWLTGDLRVRQPDVGLVPWPESHSTFSPLGYRGDAATQTIVPTYAPGLPILMAAATLVAGACGPYLLIPFCAALFVWATYAIGSQLASPSVGLMAAIAVAVSPAFVLMMIQPMSDVPNAAFWTLSIFFAGRSRRSSNAILAGVTAGIAILIRPNLAPLAAVPALLIVVASSARDLRSRLVHAGLFAAGCTPFVATVAALFDHLHGSPLSSGYGSLGSMYGLSHVASNLSVYPRFLLDTQGVAAFAFLLSPFVALVDDRQRRGRRVLYFLFIVAVFGCYLLYPSYAEWWYLRFLLPAFPFIFILGADAVSALGARAGRVAQHLALAIFAALVIVTGFTESSARNVLRELDGERRYADAATYVQASLPAGAVVLAMQHSGSLAYYSDTVPLRWDMMPVDWVDRAIEYFRARGRSVFLLLEDFELPLFAERFRGRRIEAAIRAQPLAVTMDGRVKLFAAESRSGPGSPNQMPRTYGCLPPGLLTLYRR